MLLHPCFSIKKVYGKDTMENATIQYLFEIFLY